MTIFSRIKDKDKPYPKLMKSTISGSIYLMKGLEEGTKLTMGGRCDNGHPIGCHGYKWDEGSLIDFVGTVEITSE